MIDSWKINDYLDIKNAMHLLDENFFFNTFLLKHEESMDIIENFIYQISMFHFRRLNIEFDESKHFIEFWFKKNTTNNSFHLDCDEYEKKKGLYFYPLLSSITYLNNHRNQPTLFTNVTHDKFKYKEFEEETEICLSFPREGNHVSFDGSKYHGSTFVQLEEEKNERYIIAINLWDKKPSNILYYENSINKVNKKEIAIIDNKEQTLDIQIDSFSENFFNDLFYIKPTNLMDTITNTLKQHLNSTDEKHIITIKNVKHENGLIKSKSDIIKDIFEFEENALKYNNRFLQRFVFNKFFTPETCNWIINESENHATNNGGWTTHRHNNYPTTDLPVKNIKAIFNFILSSCIVILNKIEKSYFLGKEMKINIVDLFIVKYDSDTQNKLDFHKDGSFLSFNLLLSNHNDFEGGGTCFEDGIINYLEQGDILVHCSKINHAGVAITKGKRYLLVGFLDLV